MLGHAGERHGGGVIAHHGNANSGAVDIGKMAQRRAGRHQKAVIELEHRGREIDFGGAGRLDPQKSEFAAAGLDAVQSRARRRLFDDQELGVKTIRKCTRDVQHDHARPEPVHRAGCRVLGVLRQEQRQPDGAGLGEVGGTRICGHGPSEGGNTLGLPFHTNGIGAQSPWPAFLNQLPSVSFCEPMREAPR